MVADGQNGPVNSAATLTRHEVAELFGVTPQRVIQLERAGALPQSHRSARGQVRYDAAAVVHAFLARRRVQKTEAATELAAFRLFSEGASVPEMVAALEAPATEVRRLYAEWRTPLGAKVETFADREKRLQDEHEARMRELDQQDERPRAAEDREWNDVRVRRRRA
jgi:DNA-binding transcriptional MerR regulator